MPRRSEPQAELFEEPAPNSPEDLGFGPVEPERPPDVDKRPPAQTRYGQESEGPDPVPHNVASGTIQIDDARKFVAWLHEQEWPCHADVTVGHVLVGLSGFTPKDLGWLCRACRQAERIPAPYVMRDALFRKDVGILREED